MMNNTRYTVVVSSCDKYEDLWYPFFKILSEEWPELVSDNIPVVLNTESKSFNYDGLNIQTMKFYSEGEDPPWTQRLRRTLEAIDTDYVIFLLDDFYMRKRVDVKSIEQHIKWMDDNKKISMFCYKETYASRNIRDNKYPGFERRPLFSKYKFNCQASLWRRKRLISYLRRNEDPWEWEVYGNWRSYRHPLHLFYSRIPNERYVFPYIVKTEGESFWCSGVHRGRWYLPYTDPVFKDHGISVDYSIRGTISTNEIYPVISRPEKRKIDAPKWKQLLWFARPAYSTFKDVCYAAVDVIRHIKHLF